MMKPTPKMAPTVSSDAVFSVITFISVAASATPIAEAMVFLLERSKLLVEGAGAVGVAALTAGAVEPAPDGTTVAILSGGNIDLALLAALATR